MYRCLGHYTGEDGLDVSDDSPFYLLRREITSWAKDALLAVSGELGECVKACRFPVRSIGHYSSAEALKQMR
jgi:hypothetical protein